jgi:hypothetical protein
MTKKKGRMMRLGLTLERFMRRPTSFLVHEKVWERIACFDEKRT